MKSKYRDHKEIVKQFNRDYFIAPVNGKVPIVKEVADPVTGKVRLEFYNEGDLHLLFQYDKVLTEGKKPILVPVSHIWIDDGDRRTYKGIVFDPAEKSPDYYNMYRGFDVKPEHGNCQPFLDFILETIAGGDEKIFNYILDYASHLVRRPWELPGTAIVLGGEEGTGKSFFVTQLGKLVMPYFIHLTDESSLTTRFNDMLAGNLLVFADETSVAGNKQGINQLKTMVTEPMIVVERKYAPRMQIPNYMRLFIASNEEHVIHASANDRRFLVLEVGNQHKNDFAYFQQLATVMDNGGRQALMKLLQERGLSKTELRMIPQTRAMAEQKRRSMTILQKWWHERLIAGELPAGIEWSQEIETKALFHDHCDFGDTMRVTTRSLESELGRFLHHATGEKIKRERRMINGGRVYIYRLPSLALCREQFEKAMNMKWDWDAG